MLSEYRLVHRECVRWVDLDVMGVLNNSVYLTMFEQARFAYFQHLGLLSGDRFPFVLGSTAVRFLRPVRAGAVLAIGARVSRLGGKSFDMTYAVAVGDELVAQGSATLVCVDADLRSCAIPAVFRAAVAQFEDLPAS